jgi:predicted 2-oxoglutarate/Fe(II)-dependent dioxygenase YbiX
VKKLFKVFAMLAINYNSISPFHIDINDNGMCTIVPVGNWEGGELIIPHLEIMLKLIKGQVLMFRSSLLIHGNALAKGVRFSMVFFSYNNTFKN